jgi:hypothetical protein
VVVMVVLVLVAASMLALVFVVLLAVATAVVLVVVVLVLLLEGIGVCVWRYGSFPNKTHHQLLDGSLSRFSHQTCNHQSPGICVCIVLLVFALVVGAVSLASGVCLACQ